MARGTRWLLALAVVAVQAGCGGGGAAGKREAEQPKVTIVVTETPAPERDQAARDRQYADAIEEPDDEQPEQTAAIGTDPRPHSETREPPEVAPHRYDRRQWRHWVDADGDCQDTRQEVLIAESEVPVTFETKRRCRVKTGRWTCPYTGQVFTNPRKLDVDHFVPLGHAAMAGGGGWTAAQKLAYANDLDDPEHLVAVAASANRSKGKKGPDEWLPANEAYRCQYVRVWSSIKKRWKLATSSREGVVIKDIERACQAASR